MATARRSSSASSPPPVLFLHGDGTAAASASWLEQIAALGLRCFSHREIDGVEKTEAALHQFGALCAEIADQAPGQALLVLRAGLELNAELAEVWPNITEMKDAPADAEEWAGKPNKLELLER